MATLPDQHALWNEKHAKGEHAAHRAEEMPFARRAAEFFPATASILEIGCGVGADAAFFSTRGYDVLATDISEVVIAQDKEIYAGLPVRFEQLDTTSELRFKEASFDVIYSHLALHYYDHATTRLVFEKLHHLLVRGGVLAFACKSVHDGDEVEPDLFVAKGGHARHFFSIEYVRQLLGDDYDLAVLEEGEESYSDGVSGFVYCIAMKR